MKRNAINTVFCYGKKYASPKSRFAALLPLFTALLLTFTASAQRNTEKEEAFRNTLKQRSAKIVAELNISKENKKEKLTDIIAEQYYQLNKVHDNTKALVIVIKESAKDSETKSLAIKNADTEKEKNLNRLHKKFINKLQKKLSTAQVDKVKDGMTYNVLNVTNAAYLDMILSLTDVQKQTIYNWLKEAREKAMDEGSSDDKHKVFGKYKGRINNYLSAEGYDMKAEEKTWQQRLREKRERGSADKVLQST
jgi:Protein of unknown function (DUF3826)